MSANTDNDKDIELFYSWQKGNMAAFEQLYQCHRQSLLLFLLRRGHQQAEAEEIFHDCWMRVIRHQANFQGIHFRAWLFTIARNLSTDEMRKTQAAQLDEYCHADSDVQSFSTERVQEGIDCIDLIKQSIDALPLEQRDVFLLQNEAGLTLQQIATLMDVGRETIKSRLRYAMGRLRELMAECL